MRHYKVFVLSVAVLGLLMSPAVLADCGKHDEAEAIAENQPCCSKKAQQATAELKDCCKQAGGRENCEKCSAADTAELKDCCKQAGGRENCEKCSAADTAELKDCCKQADAVCAETIADATTCCSKDDDAEE